MTVPFIDVSAGPALQDEIKKELMRMIDAAEFVGGEQVRLFSEEFAAYCGGGHCIPVANGTDALILALRALGIGAGDEVITVPFTFIATTEAITAVGASIRFVDVNPKNYTIDIDSLKKLITPKTKAILPVHLFGQPADMDPIMELARKHNLKVIEDAAQAHGAEYKGKRVGTLGDVACFSFYPTKNLGAFGDAGAVVSRDKALIDKITQIANHGRAAQYFHEIEGVNSRLDAMQAAVLRIKLRKLDDWNQRRRDIASLYNKELVKNNYIQAPVVESYAKHVFHLYCVESSYRDALQRFLKERHIGCGVYYPLALHLQPAYAYLDLKRGAFPVSERLNERILSLPMHPHLTEKHVSDVCAALSEFRPS